MYGATHSLLNSWLYLMSTPEDEGEQQRDPMQDFLCTLRRERTEPTEAMLKGREFESLVSTAARGEIAEHNWFGAAQDIAAVVAGGQEQVKLYRAVRISGTDFKLYGILDWLKAGVIYDVKYTGKYAVGKFVEYTQHPMYFALEPGAYAVEYLVSNGSTVWREKYTRAESPPIERTIAQFFAWLKERPDLMTIYQAHWDWR